jgi:C-terminal processing protease CtpA/Prc
MLTAADTLASHFTSEKIKIGSIMHKTGPGHDAYSSPEPMYLSPADGAIWERPVIVLTNRGVFSAANHFVMMMRELPHVAIVGDKTGGGSGMPLTGTLPNGWRVRLSACPTLDVNYRHTEFGIEPDIKVDITSEDWQKGRDTIIETAKALIFEYYSKKEEQEG